MSGELGKASLDLEANLLPFEKNVKSAKGTADSLQHGLDALAAVARVAEIELNKVKMDAAQGVRSNEIADRIERSVGNVGKAAMEASRHLEQVKLETSNAAETTAAGDIIDRKLKDITKNSNEARRSLESVRLASAGNPGVGIGPFGSGFGRVGLLGAAIGGATVLGPAAGPGALGLLAAIPALSGAAVGSLGAVALAFQGVGKAIGGDKKAFDDLGPAAQQFTLQIRSLDGWFDKLKETAAGSLFPGLTEGLKSALSPGTLGAVTQAIKEFGNALGQAGAMWGRYFGSAEFQSIFVPLMHAGAHEMTLMSAATLALFDAFGVLGRAAIPFTNWLVSSIAHGSQWVDTWLHAKDATGQLSHALDEAKTSLQLVGGLFVSLLRVIGALGDALYPVSKIAVKDLTDGLNALAQIIQRNRDGIREIVGGALAALVSTVKTLAPLVANLAHALNDVVHAIGGWKTAFELVIGGFLALKFVALAGVIAKIGPLLGGLGLSAEAATAEVGGLRAMLLGLGAPEVLAAIAAAAGAFALYKAFTSQQPTVVGQTGSGSNVVSSNGKLFVQSPGGGRLTLLPPGSNVLPTGGATSAVSTGADRHGPAASRSSLSTASYSKAQLAALWVQAGGDPKVADTMASIALAESSGRVSASNVNTNGTTDRGLWQINSVHGYAAMDSYNAMKNAREAVSVYNSQGLRAWTTYNTGAYLQYGAPSSTSTAFGSSPAFTKNLGAKTVAPTGANLLPETLRNALQSAKDKATTTQGAVAAHWLAVELDDLEKARKNLDGQLTGATGKHKAAIQQELRSIDGQIASVNRQITVNLKSQATAIKQAFSSKISTAKANISSAVDALKSSLDLALGARFFQGGQTPLEKQLADMQAADTAQSLQDALAQAVASGDPAQVAAAQRAITENNLAIAAAAERAKADKDYADAQRDLNLQITMWARGVATGATKLDDLNGIVSAFGLTLSDSGVIEDFATLQSAVQDLAAVMIAQAQALGGVGDNKDAQAAAARAAALSIPAGAAALIPGTGISFAGFVAASLARNAIPKLDTGGWVEQTGLAVVHRGEMYSGVGSNRTGGKIEVNVNGFVGNEAELAMQIGKLLEAAAIRGVRFAF